MIFVVFYIVGLINSKSFQEYIRYDQVLLKAFKNFNDTTIIIVRNKNIRKNKNIKNWGKSIYTNPNLNFWSLSQFINKGSSKKILINDLHSIQNINKQPTFKYQMFYSKYWRTINFHNFNVYLHFLKRYAKRIYIDYS